MGLVIGICMLLLFYLFLILTEGECLAKIFVQSPIDIYFISHSRIAGDCTAKAIIYSSKIFLVSFWSWAHYFVNGCI